MLVGSGGVGKSTLARRLGRILDLPVVHLDREYWQPGWTPPDGQAWQARGRELAAADEWILDGNYSGSARARIERANLIVLLDLPRRIALTGAIRRRLRWRKTSRPDMAPDCPERFTWEFARWIWSYPSGGRERMLRAVRAADAEDRLVRLRSRREIASWVDQMSRRRPGSH